MADPVEDLKRDERQLRALLGREPLPENQPLLGTAPLPTSPEAFAPSPENVTDLNQSEFSRGLEQADVQDDITRIGLQMQAAGLQGDQETIDRLQPELEALQERARFVGPRVQSLAEAGSVEDAFDFIKGGVGSQGPQLVKAAVGGLIGAAAGTVLGGPAGTAIGAGLGAGAVATALETAEGAPEALTAEDTRFTLQERAQINMGAGILRGSLDAFPVFRLLRRIPVLRGLKKDKLQKEIMQRVEPTRLQSAMQQLFAEGSTEVLQETIGMATQRYIEDNWEKFSSEELFQLADAFTLGATLGGGLGAIIRERPSGQFTDAEKKLLKRLDAHLTGEKPLEEQIKEEASGKDSLAGTEELDVDAATVRNVGEDAEQQAREQIREETDTAAREELAADIEAFKEAAKKKGKDVTDLGRRAMRYIRGVAARRTRKVRNFTKKRVEQMRTKVDEADERLKERFDPENATDQGWVKFAKKAIDKLRGDAPLATAAPGQRTTDVRRVMAGLDRIQQLADRLASDQFTDEQKAVLRKRLSEAVSQVKSNKAVVKYIEEINDRPTPVIHPEVQEYVRAAITQGRPAEVMMEVFGLTQGDLDFILTAEERPFIRSRSEMDADEALEHDNDVRAEIQALGLEEIGSIQATFDNLSEADFDALLAPEQQQFVEEDTEMQATAKEMEAAANVLGFQVEEEPTGPQPHVMPNGRLKVGLSSKASKNPNKPSAMEKMVDDFNATFGPRAGLVQRLKKFSEFIEEAVRKAPNDRSATETQVVGGERILTKGLEDRIRKAYFVKPDKSFGDYWVILEEESNPDVTTAVPYLLNSAEVADVFAKRTDTKDLPVDPHNAVDVNGVKINLVRLTDFARKALLNRSPKFWEGTLDTATRTAREGQFKQRTHLEQAVIAYYHGVADLITRGVIDSWPTLRDRQVIYSTQVGGEAVKVRWKDVKRMDLTNDYRRLAKGMTQYLVDRFETQISRHKSTLQRVSDLESALRNSQDPVLAKELQKWQKAKAKAHEFFKKTGIDPSRVQLDLNGDVENLTDFMPAVRKATTLGLADQFRQEEAQYEQTIREEVKKLKAELRGLQRRTDDERVPPNRVTQIDERLKMLNRWLDGTFEYRLSRYYENSAAARNAADFAGQVGMSGATDIAGHAAKIRGLANAKRERELPAKDRKKLREKQWRLHILETEGAKNKKEEAEMKRLRKEIAQFYMPSEIRKIKRFQAIYSRKALIDIIPENAPSDIFFGAIDNLRREMGMEIPAQKQKGYVKETLAYARAEIDNFQFNYIARDMQTELSEIIGDIAVEELNNVKDVKNTPDVTWNAALFDAPEEISSLIARDILVTPTPARGKLRKQLDPKGRGAETFSRPPLSDAAVGRLNPLMVPVEQYEHILDSANGFLADLRQLGIDLNERVTGATLKKLEAAWNSHFLAGFDLAAAKNKFNKQWAEYKRVRGEGALQAVELELFKMARWPVSQPPLIGNSFNELTKVLPNNPKVRKLLQERRQILLKLPGRNPDLMSQATEADLVSQNFVIMNVRQDADLPERMQAMRRSFKKDLNEAAARKRFLAWAEWASREKAPGIRFPTGTFNNVLTAKAAEDISVYSLVEEALQRVTEAVEHLPPTEVTRMVDDVVKRGPLNINTVADLIQYVNSVRAQSRIAIAMHRQNFSTSTRQSHERLGDVFRTEATQGGNEYTDAETMERIRRIIETMSYAEYSGELTQWEEMLGAAGLYYRQNDVIKISELIGAMGDNAWAVAAAGHEAFHSLWFTVLSPAERALLTRVVVRDDALMKRVAETVADLHAYTPEQKAQHKQAILDEMNDPIRGSAERVAYTFQAYAFTRLSRDRDTFRVARPAQTMFEKIIRILKTIFRFTSAEAQVDNLFDAALSGGIKQAHIQGRTLDFTNGMSLDAAVQGIYDAWRAAQFLTRGFLLPMDTALRQTKIPALQQLADLIFVGPAHKDKGGKASTSFLNSHTREWIEHSNAFQRRWDNMSPQGRAAVRDALYSRTPDAELDPMTKADVRWMRKFFEDILAYAKKAGADIGDIPNFVPVRWDPELVARHERELRALIEEKATAQELADMGGINTIMERLKSNPDVMGEDRFVANFDTKEISQRKRMLSFLNDQDLSMWMEKDFEATMMGYIKQMTRMAEFARKFGHDGKVVRDLLSLAREQGASQREIDDAHNYVLAARGQLGANISESMSKTLAWIATYQHLRVLAFATFASFAEVIGIGLRSQDVKATWEALKVAWDQVHALYTNHPRRRQIKKRMKELSQRATLRPEEDIEYTNLAVELQNLETEHDRFAREMGTLDGVVMFDQILAATGSMDIDSVPRKVNEWFFKWNGLQGWTALTRKMATRAAYVFIKENALHPRKHSARFLKDLGLTRDDLVFDANGELLTSVEAIEARLMEQPGRLLGDRDARAVAEEQALKLKQAIWQFVDESILRPNAATRPLRASDPHWQLLFHMKHFIFAMHHQILGRVYNEAVHHKNFMPVGIMALYPGIMFVSDFFRSTIQYGLADEEDEWRNPYNKYSFGELMMRSTRRSGVLGILEPYTGFGDNINRFGGTGFEVLTGPTIQQGAELIRTITTGSPSAYKAMHNALPLSNVYRNWGNPFN